MTIQNPATTTKQSHPSVPHSRFSPAGKSFACAACKHQRRRCAPSCALAPYFPAEKKNGFLNVHRLFGISYVVKLLKTVPENVRDDAMASVIYEADIRAARPVGGCCSVVNQLARQIAMCEAELQIIKNHIDFLRGKLQQNVTYYYDIGGTSIDNQMPFFDNQEYWYGNQEFNNNGVGHHFLNDELG